MYCNDKNTRRKCNFSILFGCLVPRKLHDKVYFFRLVCLLLGQSMQHSVHLITHVIVDSDDMMQSNGMRFQHPLGPVPEWP